MKFLNVFMLLVLFCNLSYCGSAKKAFSNQKKNNSDEFLVEKKSPLVMPPDYGELPKPDQNIDKSENNNEKIKELFSTENKDSEGQENQSLDIEENILKKIKKTNANK
ncbi:DUF3035 domain-containing protein [Candidatus Pelagibacter sp. HIMB1695]|uniref:DUF3035 domain-containing protein n=1 Tax=Candidatus Pelagibacter sp. HIMB1695 TaxID=3413364 RepID=UPI003F828324